MQEAGIEVATWKIEGIERREDCEAIAAACRAGGREAGCLILGRGADEAKVEHWLEARRPGPRLRRLRRRPHDLVGRRSPPSSPATATHAETVATIATRYLHFVSTYLSAR